MIYTLLLLLALVIAAYFVGVYHEKKKEEERFLDAQLEEHKKEADVNKDLPKLVARRRSALYEWLRQRKN